MEKVEGCEEDVCEEEEVAVEEVKDDQSKMEGITSIALLPDGSISGHFVHLPHSVCYGIHGTDDVFGH
ncbi:unnamed protein product [Lactuca virosa]|uniref:Uncharacterized protein n=1 Tax=Lactuca virosa TaxID=75947 RepID=A0AAU9LW57_9ASTR|nr:unnamed protein product [Lactuca virosa]